MYLTDLITNGTNPTSLTSWLALNATIEQQDGVSGIRLTSGGYVKQTIAFDTYKINTETFLTSLQVIVPYDLSTDKCKAKAVLSITYTDGKIDTYNYYFTNNNKNATQNTLFETIATVDRPLEVNSITFMVQAETLLETDLCFIKAIKLFPSEEGVQEGVPYYGVKITKEQGLQVERSDKASKVILNSDEFTFYKGDVRKLYFDAVSGEYVFDGTLQIGGTDISGKLTQITSEGIYTGKVSANQIQMSEVDGFISFDDLTDKPTYTAADVGARPYDWNPQYTDILGTKPPTDADNTSSFVGSRLSYIDSYGAYFATAIIPNT
jgi:hypothetical protein